MGNKCTFSFFQVLSNGGVGFDQNSRNYKNNILHNGPALIAPLWNRNDLRKGGQIYYREVTGNNYIFTKVNIYFKNYNTNLDQVFA